MHVCPQKAYHCECVSDTVRINMDVFLEKYRPEQWQEVQQQRAAVRVVDVIDTLNTPLM